MSHMEIKFYGDSDTNGEGLAMVMKVGTIGNEIYFNIIGGGKDNNQEATIFISRLDTRHLLNVIQTFLKYTRDED